MSEKKEPCDVGDEVLVGPELSEGRHLGLRHTADCQVVPTVFRPVKDGEPLLDGAFTLNHVEGNRYKIQPIEHVTTGPAQVNSAQYRANWDRIFGTKPTVGLA